MHPLRFPNSGIRAKVFMRKIGFKLRVMRLNRVKLFYTFFLRFRSEEEGRPATASPHAGLTTRGQVGYKGQPAATGMASTCRGGACGRRQRPQPSCRGWLLATRP
ncbi:hypothetical protein BHE74_00049962 [Ensete ventricosum]|nr:hypothetical protein BHE74_00049962 [Ensete ventricosum]